MSLNNLKIEEKLVWPSLSNLIEKDLKLLQNNIKEESINHRFAIYLENNLNKLNIGVKYDVDVEYDKLIDSMKQMMVDDKNFVARPDILIHQRKSVKNNLLAVEAKKISILLKDEQKIRGFLDYDYNFQFGLLLTYGISRRDYIISRRDYIRYVLFYKPNHPDPPIYSKIVRFYSMKNIKIINDWNLFIPRNYKLLSKPLNEL
jgi:hypothetical protein